MRAIGLSSAAGTTMFVALLVSTAAQAQSCGTKSTDWCPVAAGDSCGRHRTVAACRGDQACYGLPYRGESVIACSVDGRGFGTNCPTVGCTSSPPGRN